MDKNLMFYFSDDHINKPLIYGWIKFIKISDLAFMANAKIEPRRQGYYEINCVTSGKGTIKKNNILYQVKQNDIFIITPGEYFEGHADKFNPFRYFSLGFLFNRDCQDFSSYNKIKNTFDQSIHPIIKDTYNIKDHFIGIYSELVGFKEYSNDLIGAHLQQIILFTRRLIISSLQTNYKYTDSYANHELVYRIVNYIDSNIGVIRGIDEITKSFDYSYSYLTHQFSKNMGITIKKYFDNRRFEKAVELFQKGKMNITQIATFLGYSSIHSFSKAFKNHYGLSPKEYIELYTQKSNSCYVCCATSQSKGEIIMKEHETNLSLKPAAIILDPINPKYKSVNRKWQGIPSIAITNNDTLWVAFYSGGTKESQENYVLVIRSDDKGKTWSDIKIAIEHSDNIRSFDPCVWTDPQDNLWITWAQSFGLYDARCGVWAIKTENPDSASPKWSDPLRIANGIMLNKPTFLSTGEWILPCAVWKCQEPDVVLHETLEKERFSNVYSSTDNGKTFKLKGSADVPNRHYDEHKVIEKNDRSLWMLVRTNYGIGQSFSYDLGKTWSHGEATGLGGPSSRFHISRLASGNLLLVNHYKYTGRNNLTAMISKDDGKTWEGYISIDERNSISYPNATQGNDGYIYIVYDRERNGEGAKEILMATLKEEDILAGKCVSERAQLKYIISKAGK